MALHFGSPVSPCFLQYENSLELFEPFPAHSSPPYPNNCTQKEFILSQEMFFSSVFQDLRTSDK